VSRSDSRRLLVFTLVAAIVFALAAAWLKRFWERPSHEERAREKAGEVRDRVRDLTHGK